MQQGKLKVTTMATMMEIQKGIKKDTTQQFVNQRKNNLLKFLVAFCFSFLVLFPAALDVPVKSREHSGVVLYSEYEKEVRCIEEVLAYEAFGEPIKGIEAVLSVIVNRKNKSNETFCEVVRKTKQFSYRNLYSRDEDLPMDRFRKHKKYAVVKALAHSAYFGSFDTTLPPDTLYFISKNKKVYWNKHKNPVIVIGSHSFYN